MLSTQKSPFALDAVPFGGANIDELLQYGSDADVRTRLESIADAMHEAGLDLDGIETLAAEKADLEEKVETLESELNRYKMFFGDILEYWRDTLADGAWPCAEPDDQAMLQAIYEDMERGADAIEVLARRKARKA